ncbi:MAG: AAA family ATPase [Bacteroidaceae bacterium]|nr:AAA family ATPase [Bacteroidaceae bacterium]
MRAVIIENCPFQPTKDQLLAANLLASFIFNRDNESIFILRGYAGTGKTSLVSALVRTLVQFKQNVVLMAPTGRAAKVFSLHSGQSAYTIHKRIYRQKAFTGDMVDFLQGVNLMKHTLFIVDEASMVSNEGTETGVFGTGRLLDDLIHFVYGSEGCRLLMVGDTAQLPPVGEEQSPALFRESLECYGLNVMETSLKQVVRQLDASGILWNATALRSLIADNDIYSFPKLKLTGFADIVNVPGNELIETLENSYDYCGFDGTIVITRSNKRANAYNNGIRARVLDYDDELVYGDQLIIVRNNYHWVKPSEENQDTKQMDFIANGDIAVVRHFRNVRDEYGFRFADVTLCFPDFDDFEVDATIILDTLQAEAPALPRSSMQQLFDQVWDDYEEILTKRERMKAVKEDPYFNALQVKYAYAVTCHKAQGGQWQHVFIDQGFITEDMLSPDYFRWLYTALTRATERVFLVNWPSEFQS